MKKSFVGASALVFVMTVLMSAAAFGQITVTKIGNPAWEPADIHMFAVDVPAGTVTTDLVLPIYRAVFPVPQHVWLAEPASFVVHAGLPHQSPCLDPVKYDCEVSVGMTAAGYSQPVDFTFNHQDVGSTRAGIALMYVIVPTASAPTGSSPDFTSGSIIPKAAGLNSRNSLSKNGLTVVSYAPLPVPGVNVDDTSPYQPFDGFSHIPWTSGIWTGFGAGMYVETQTIVDGSGDNGWTIEYRFRIVENGKSK